MVAMLEHDMRSVVKIGAQPVLVGAWLAIGEVGLGCLWIVMREGWAKMRDRWWVFVPELGWANHLCSFFLLSSSLSLFVSKSWNSFEGKIETKIHFRLGWVTLRSTRKLISVWPNFLCLPNTWAGVKWFPEILFSQNKRSLNNNQWTQPIALIAELYYGFIYVKI